MFRHIFRGSGWCARTTGSSIYSSTSRCSMIHVSRWIALARETCGPFSMSGKSRHPVPLWHSSASRKRIPLSCMSSIGPILCSWATHRGFSRQLRDTINNLIPSQLTSCLCCLWKAWIEFAPILPEHSLKSFLSRSFPFLSHIREPLSSILFPDLRCNFCLLNVIFENSHTCNKSKP